MPTVIQQSRTEDVITYLFEYEWVNDPGAGYGFECDANGVLEEPEHPSVAIAEKLLAEGKLIKKGVRKYQNVARYPAIIECDVCRNHVSLDSAWLNPCSCGADYDGAGNRLAPRSQWGEETGESLSDILGCGRPDDR